MNIYKPQSHFFTELLKLAPASGTEGFGPVNGSPTTKYRTTSKVKANNTNDWVKLYAICNGKILIQPQDNDSSKINIIIKPSENNYSPLKIKYFIYRGINKADYFTGNVLNQPAADKPDTLKTMWLAFIALNGLSSSVGSIFPLTYIYDFAAPSTKLIDNAFQSSLISCSKGDYIGNFKGEIGLDIVLDHGDYTLENQGSMFNFDLKFARAQEFIFDTDTVSGAVNKKKFKENIHQFIDAAAFWGSHINCGKIKFKDGSEVSNTDDISKILKTYQTGNKLYIYLRGEDNRSFNYYDSARKIYGFDDNGEDNKTDDWPILIKESDADKSLLIEYQIDNNPGQNNINKIDRQISLELISGNESYLQKKTGARDILLSKGSSMIHDLRVKSTSTVTIESGGPLPAGLQLIPSGINKGKIFGTPTKSEIKKITFAISDTYNGVVSIRKETLIFYVDLIDVPLKFNISNSKACADMIFINCSMQQKFPLQNYYDHLWIANIKSSVEFDASVKMHWATYDKSRNINLNDTIKESAILQNKVVFDKGVKKGATGASATKNRRLFVATVKRNSGVDHESESLNLDKVSSTYVNDIHDKETYFSSLFNDINFSIFKGELTAGGKVIKPLTLFHEVSIPKKYSYMLLGITEDEYSKFIIPADVDNVFFNLEEEPVDNENVRKFKLGIRYEQLNSQGKIEFTTFYPSAGNEVYVYSLDDLFFFSQEFSDYQEFYNEFAPLKIEFRTVPRNIDPPNVNFKPYDGEFGFDWFRNGDNYYKSLVAPVVIPDINFYDGIKGGYERPRTLTDNSEYENTDEALKFLIRQYPCIPTQASSTDKGIYSIPYLSLFPQDFKVIYSADVDGHTPPPIPYEANLRILITNPLAKKGTIKFICEKNDAIKLDKTSIVNLQDNTKKILNQGIKITCLKGLSEPVNIKALYFPPGADINNNKKGILAGMIVLNKNDGSVRKDVNILLLNCETNIDGVGVVEYTPFTSDDKKMMYNVFHQMLLLPKVQIQKVTLTAEDKFVLNKPGTFVYKETGGDLVLNTDHYLDVFSYLYDILPKGYEKWLRLYSFGLNGRNPSGTLDLAGIARDIGEKQAMVFSGHKIATGTHEGLHALSLYHTHQDKETSGSLIPITDPDQKFVFMLGGMSSPDTKSTENIMSYTDRRHCIWNWQSEIIHKFLHK
ncbi:hypothetical protein [Chryseobacterium paludis]|uniref:hypothetical protein n=1 Tax=Chryseobacterium paludis TaxID=2956784 RepID=UPI0021C19CB7|nr:hypothetical protein [Chryseobacterium paludis]